MPSPDLVFDLGMHRGEDTDFYLKKGFRVVAVDANPALCAEAETRFATAISSGALTVVNCAIAAEAGEVTLYADEFTAWSTIDERWASRNRRREGTTQEEVRVPATTLDALIEEHGAPYYLKVDIEGMDVVALHGLARVEARPTYVSIESEKVSFRALREEIELLADLGYGGFKLVSQRNVPRQRLPRPAQEGRYVDHAFELGSSGAFGEEAPGEWISADAAIERYRRVFLGYAFNGDDPLVRSRALRNMLKAAGFRYDWYDTHARLGGVN